MDRTGHRFEAVRVRDKLDPDLVLQELARIVASSAFQSSQRRRDLLSWLVRLSLENRGGEISERAIAAAVFGKTDDFEPTEDAIVRVEFSRLRASLDTYYSREGRTDPIQISIPKRTYIPEFLIRVEDFAEVGAPVEAPGTITEAPPASPRELSLIHRRPWLIGPAVALLVLTFVASRAFFSQPRTPESQPVTLLPGRQVQPSLSPDHSLVAFSWDEEGAGNFQLFIKPLEGMGVTRLTTGPGASQSPAWSPDGNSIAFLRRLPNHGQEVRMIPAKGGAERVLTSVSTIVQGIAWTPDSRNLIVPDSSESGTPLALFLVSVATGERHRLTEYGSYFHPDISPNGRMLAFATDAQPGRLSAICLLPLGPDSLPAGPVTVLHQTIGEVLFWPTWNPGGESVLYARQLNSIWSLYRVSVASGQVQPFPAAGTGVTYGREFSPARYLLIRQRERDFLARIPHGSKVDNEPIPKPIPLFQSVEQDIDCGVSPDGRKIVFNSQRGGQRGLWIANADGTGALQIQVPGGFFPKRPVWTPDGRYVYFWATPSGATDRKSRILCARAAPMPIQAEFVQLDGADNLLPAVSRDGRWLYFTSNRTGSFQIWRTLISGGSMEAMSPPIITSPPPVGEESFDGEFLFYSSSDGIWRLSLRDRKRELYLPVGSGSMRVAENGIYYDTVASIPDGVILFHPFAAHATELKFSLGQHHGWSPMPAGQGLLASLVREESNLELYTPR